MPGSASLRHPSTMHVPWVEFVAIGKNCLCQAEVPLESHQQQVVIHAVERCGKIQKTSSVTCCESAASRTSDSNVVDTNSSRSVLPVQYISVTDLV